LFQFGQGQTQFTQGQDQFDPYNSADAFIRSVQHYVGNGGSISDLGATFGSIRRPNETLQHMDWASKIASQQGGPGAFQPDTQSGSLAGTAPADAQAPPTTGIDPALTQRIKELQAAMALGSAPTLPSSSAPDYASLNLAAGGMGGTGNYALIQAIRNNQIQQALKARNAAKAGGQLVGQAGGLFPSTGGMTGRLGGGMADPFEPGGSLAFG
jgi:hypothetical protein